jgi:hypothetical protein
MQAPVQVGSRASWFGTVKVAVASVPIDAASMPAVPLTAPGAVIHMHCCLLLLLLPQLLSSTASLT